MSNENEDFDLNEKSEHEDSPMDPFDRLMFGARPAKRNENKESVEKSNQNHADGVDINQLMGQISDIMTSIDKIKPALKDLSPLLDYFRKK
jgi:hypothetical protein